MEKIAFLFPGQGSQYIGMGREFFDHYSFVRELFEEASEYLEIDFKKLCFEGPENVLVRTENIQPAITLINTASFHVLQKEGIKPTASAGHSLGEYSALYAANAFGFKDVMKLVHFRGLFMQKAADQNPGGMMAIVGLDFEKLSDICQGVKEIGSVEIANHNSPKQLILTGEKKGLEKASALAKKEGAKLAIPLKVSGPWHSKFMGEAQVRMQEVLGNYSVRVLNFPVVANYTSDYETKHDETRRNLVHQITSPVLWTDSILRLIRDGYKNFIEVGPNKVLTKLMREINREVKAINVENMDTLEKCKRFFGKNHLSP